MGSESHPIDMKQDSSHVENVYVDDLEAVHVTKSKVTVSGTVKLTEGKIVYIPTPTADPRGKYSF